MTANKFSEWNRKVRHMPETQLVESALELERALNQFEQARRTGQGFDQIKVFDENYSVLIDKRQGQMKTMTFNNGSYNNLKKMRAIVLTKLGTKREKK